MLTFQDVKNNVTIRTYIQRADESLTALGYTEHSFAHVTTVAETAASYRSTAVVATVTCLIGAGLFFLYNEKMILGRIEELKKTR